jgi:hypothetical protein
MIPKDSWSFVGYATPEAAFQSVAWAMNKGDVKTFLASLTPEAQKFFAEKFEGKSENESAAMLSDEISGIAGLRLNRRKTSTQSEVTFVVFSTGQDNGVVKTHDEAIMKFKNIGGEWKFAASE